MDDALSDLITFIVTVVVHAWVGLLIAVIVASNVYALVHAWRSDRIGWFLVILLTGGGIATAIYLVLHIEERLPRRSSRRVPAAA